MAQVTLREVTKSFGDVQVIRRVDLNIADGKFRVFVGPSGCGKSTLLRLIAGLEDLTEGVITIGDQDVTWLAPSQRGISMVFQSYALYPHMTVAENIAFGLKMARRPEAEIESRTRKAAQMLQLTEMLKRRPAQLSGGQRQRVAIGRAIVREPEVFLFDEPLSNLDAALRVQMRLEISKLHNDLKATMIYVTHDQVEAMTMAEKIVVLNSGRVEQVGGPLELYHRPRNLFVATFIGSPKMNVIEGMGEAGEGGRSDITLPGGARVSVEMRGKPPISGPIMLGVRPEHVVVVAPPQANEGVLSRVLFTEHLGGETMLYLEAPGIPQLVAKTDGLAAQKVGDEVRAVFPSQTCHLFDASGAAVVNGSLI